MIADALLSVLLSPVCAACSAVLDSPLSGCVCARCWSAVRPAVASDEAIGNLDGFAAVGEYEGALREIVHAFKYQGRRSLAKPLAALMRERAALLLSQADYVVPVPLHWRREWARGFNQSRELAVRLGPPVLDALSRSRATLPQVALAANRRHENVRGAFTLRRRWKRTCMTNQTIIIVDDVSTTGATLEECATTLKRAGATSVYALTTARVSSLPGTAHLRLRANR